MQWDPSFGFGRWFCNAWEQTRATTLLGAHPELMFPVDSRLRKCDEMCSVEAHNVLEVLLSSFEAGSSECVSLAVLDKGVEMID